MNKRLEMTDAEFQFYNKGILEGKKHTEPSPKTVARLDKIDGDILRLAETFNNHDHEERTQWNAIREISATLQRVELSGKQTLNQAIKTNGKVAEHERLIHNLEVQYIKDNDGANSEMKLILLQMKQVLERISRIEKIIWSMIILTISTVVISLLNHIIKGN